MEISEKRIAVLSNVNMNFTLRKLQRQIKVYQTEGYGNELGLLLDPGSSYMTFKPQITFLIMDLSELVAHSKVPDIAQRSLETWFSSLESSLKENVIYYISDGYYWNPELLMMPCDLIPQRIENQYLSFLQKLLERHDNVRVFPLAALIRKVGEENAFSLKTWYLGRILFSNEMQGLLAEKILMYAETESRSPKKVLALDLDNTLWGGLAGDYPETELQLSEDHDGLAYRNSQRLLLEFKKSGVLLVVVSKNNPEDAWNVIDHHPQMILKREDFAAARINWNSKDVNLREIAEELNLGLDSFVFWDDQKTERALISELLPEVSVPDFPESPEELAEGLKQVYDSYFRKGRLTKEDSQKTESYAQNEKRKELLGHSGDFSTYLKNLNMKLQACDPGEHSERMLQLLNKTNQFNLTTKRYTQDALRALLDCDRIHCFLYRVEDCFGDYGITAIVIVNCQEEFPVITDFCMSCRIMGKHLEDAIIDGVEQTMRQLGYHAIRALYIPSKKNLPVAELYDRLGYSRIQDKEKQITVGNEPFEGLIYQLSLDLPPKREYYVEYI